jgi:hypothetical protein
MIVPLRLRQYTASELPKFEQIVLASVVGALRVHPHEH